MLRIWLLSVLVGFSGLAMAEAPGVDTLEHCANLTDSVDRLTCFDTYARSQVASPEEQAFWVCVRQANPKKRTACHEGLPAAPAAPGALDRSFWRCVNTADSDFRLACFDEIAARREAIATRAATAVELAQSPYGDDDKMTALGLRFGAGLAMPECTHTRTFGDHWRYEADYKVEPKPCYKHGVLGSAPGTPIDPRVARLQVVLPSAPQGLYWDDVHVLLLDGRLEAMTVKTHGRHQATISAMLHEKYGAPASSTETPIQNAMGASFASVTLTWSLPHLTVRYQGLYDQIDTGMIFLDTPKALAHRAAEAEADKASRLKF